MPALVEKVMNGIDAILEKKVVEAGIDIRSDKAPISVQDALDRYFPGHKNWDLYANSLTSTLLASQNAVNLNL